MRHMFHLSHLLAAAFVACTLVLSGCSGAGSAAAGSGSAAAEAAKYQKIGNPTFGYISVPKEWVKIDTQEVATGDGSVASDLSQGIYYADSDGTDATVMVGMLSYGTFDHDLDDKVADEFVTTLQSAGYQNVTQVDRPIGGDITSYCFTVTMSSGNPGAIYLIKNGTNLIGVMISAADSDTVNTYLDLVQTSYATAA